MAGRGQLFMSEHLAGQLEGEIAARIRKCTEFTGKSVASRAGIGRSVLIIHVVAGKGKRVRLAKELKVVAGIGIELDVIRKRIVREVAG